MECSEMEWIKIGLCGCTHSLLLHFILNFNGCAAIIEFQWKQLSDECSRQPYNLLALLAFHSPIAFTIASFHAPQAITHLHSEINFDSWMEMEWIKIDWRNGTAEAASKNSERSECLERNGEFTAAGAGNAASQQPWINFKKKLMNGSRQSGGQQIKLK